MRLFSVFSTLGVMMATPTLAGGITILAMGDSLTAGYGLPPSQAFPAVLERELVSRGWEVRVINAGVSGDTSAGGRSRMAWALADKPRLVVLALGANDALRGLSPQALHDNLEAMIQAAQDSGARVVLVGMYAPRNWDADYQQRFNAVYPELAQRYGLALYPFFLEGVYGHPELLLEDGMHPNAAGVERMVAGVLPLVEAELKRLRVEEGGSADHS
jgi:acyl-CoA thioesterase-1